jgi:ACS family sodium-dependent inorganic phosphate cotransporter
MQIPAGVLADRMGGIKALLLGLFVWSSFGILMLGIPLSSSPIVALLGLRCGLGLGQSVLMPGISATAAQSFAPTDRGDKTSGIYACYSLGTVFGLIITPILADVVSWSGSFGVFGVVGLIFCIFGAMNLKLDGLDPTDSFERVQRHNVNSYKNQKKSGLVHFRRHAKDLSLLCWTHAVIGFGFFVLQSWIPTFLHGLGITNLKSLGFLSAIPWLLTAVVAAFSGKLSLHLQIDRSWSPLQVRRLMQTVSSIGIAFCLIPLAIDQTFVSPLIATVMISIAVAFQGLCYPGFHSYVQDVASKDAGLVLALTNTCSIAAGILGNIITGHLAASPLGFSAVFGLTSVLYISSAITWYAFANGNSMELTNEMKVSN